MKVAVALPSRRWFMLRLAAVTDPTSISPHTSGYPHTPQATAPYPHMPQATAPYPHIPQATAPYPHIPQATALHVHPHSQPQQHYDISTQQPQPQQQP